MNIPKPHAIMASLFPNSHQSSNTPLSLPEKSKYRLGIIQEFDNNHLPYITACEDYAAFAGLNPELSSDRTR